MKMTCRYVNANFTPTLTFFDESGKSVKKIEGMEAIRLHNELLWTDRDRREARVYELYLQVSGPKPPPRKRRK